ncbi:MAG TPA: hypothetical protein ENN65_07175 [Candidatus Hydrogenedentes bacterium]|nr:hypothetical protein [Candidatus Hydrogenedentota bacterium]
MQLSNDPDIAIAQEWASELEQWIRRHGLRGYDPFDVKQHPLLRAMQGRRLTRRASTALCDLFPTLIRRALRIAPTENPKAHALAALGRLRLFQVTGDSEFLDLARGHLQWLREHACPDQPGLCWGYPFAVRGKGVEIPAGMPVAVVGAIAGEAYLLAHEITDETDHLDAAQSIAKCFLDVLPQMPQSDGTCCFAYAPGDRRRVHNANLLVAELLARVHAVTGDTALAGPADAALQFTLSRQREDGSWPYGEYEAGEPFEEGLLRLVDHHHTGFVLRSLHRIYLLRREEPLRDALRKGFRYYQQKLFLPSGMPVNAYGRYPVDIHACAEAVLCCSVLSESIAGAKNQAIRTMRWTWYRLRRPDDGAPMYRAYPGYTVRIIFPRWGVAWMHRALAEYVYRFRA